MVTFKAHFDGKAIVPDEPVSLTPNQQLRIIALPTGDAEPEAAKPRRVDLGGLRGVAAAPGDRPYHPDDEDSLWGNGCVRPPRTDDPMAR